MSSQSRVWLVACLVVSATSIVSVSGQAGDKPYPLFTEDHLVATMKTMGANFSGANGLLETQDYEAAKAQFIRTREQLARTVTFWRDRDRDDAIDMLRDALTSLDSLDTEISAAGQLDSAAVSGLVGQIGGACQACHAVYREQDPATGQFRVKASALSGP
jgi:hypothetical protein